MLRFWVLFQHHLTPIPIPIPTEQALIPILIQESDSDSGINYISARGRPAHRAKCFAIGLFRLIVIREKICLSQNWCGIRDIHTKKQWKKICKPFPLDLMKTFVYFLNGINKINAMSWHVDTKMICDWTSGWLQLYVLY